MNRKTKGAILILLASLFWGVAGTVAKIMFNSAMNPLEVASMRMSLAAVILFIYLSLTNSELLKVNKKDLKQIAILGIIGIAFMQSSYYYAISRLNVSLAIFLQFLSPIIITVFCILVYKEKLSGDRAAALFLSMIGSYLIIFGGGSMGVELNWDGVLVGLSSAFFSAFYVIYGKGCTARFHPWTILVYGLGAGAFMFMFLMPPWMLWANRTSSELLFVLYLAVFGTIIPFALYLNGVKYLAPATAGIINMTETVVASLSAYLILGEYMSPKQFAGAAMIMLAVLTLQVGAELWKKIRRKVNE